jgi:hypothetical protein
MSAGMFDIRSCRCLLKRWFAEKDTTRVAAGLKAAINNPNVSPEAKNQAAAKLQNLSGTVETSTASSTEHENRVLGGFRAVLSSEPRSFLSYRAQILIAPADENTSADAKRHAKEVLSAAGYQVEKPMGSTDEEHETRVMAGYKAALASM